MADLHWFQYDVAVWEKVTRDMGLSLEEEGILMRLLRAAWSNPVPCTILDSEDEFARILGKRWRAGLPLIRRIFTPNPEHPGRLWSAQFAEIYARAQQKHESYSARGKQGGRPKKEETKAGKKAPGKPQLSVPALENGSSASVALARQNTAEGNSCALSEHTAITPAPGGALALEGARAAGAEPPPGWLDSMRDELTAGLEPHERARAAAKIMADRQRIAALPSRQPELVQ